METCVELKIFHCRLVSLFKIKRSGLSYYIASVCGSPGCCFPWPQAAEPTIRLAPAKSQIVNNYVVQYVETIYSESYESDQNWADHAVAFECWDMIMNQRLKVFHFISLQKKIILISWYQNVLIFWYFNILRSWYLHIFL